MPNALTPPEALIDVTTVISRVDAWRRIGALTEARRSAERALADRPYDAGLHDALARVLVDVGEMELANDAWQTSLSLLPGHVGALKGLGFLAFRRGDLPAARQLLGEANMRSPSDAGLRGALERLQGITQPVPPSEALLETPPQSAASVEVPAPIRETAPAERAQDSESFLLLCDVDGLVLAGTIGGLDGAAQRAEVACEVSALATAIERACRHLGIGAWTSCLLESEGEAYGVGRSGPDAFVLSAAHGEGAAGRVLARAHEDAQHARTRLEGSK